MQPRSLDPSLRDRIVKAIVDVNDELNEGGGLGSTLTNEAVAEESGTSIEQVKEVVAELLADGILRGPMFGIDDFVLTEKAKKWRQRLGL